MSVSSGLNERWCTNWPICSMWYRMSVPTKFRWILRHNYLERGLSIESSDVWTPVLFYDCFANRGVTHLSQRISCPTPIGFLEIRHHELTVQLN